MLVGRGYLRWMGFAGVIGGTWIPYLYLHMKRGLELFWYREALERVVENIFSMVEDEKRVSIRDILWIGKLGQRKDVDWDAVDADAQGLEWLSRWWI